MNAAKRQEMLDNSEDDIEFFFANDDDDRLKNLSGPIYAILVALALTKNLSAFFGLSTPNCHIKAKRVQSMPTTPKCKKMKELEKFIH